MEARVPVAPGFDEVWRLICIAVIENSKVNQMVQRTRKCLLMLRGYSWLMIRSYCKCRANGRRSVENPRRKLFVSPSRRIQQGI